MGRIFGGAFVLSLVISFVLVLFLGPERDAMMGASAGFMAGLFWVAAAMGITYTGYHVITFTVMGMILGAWR